MGLLSFLLLVSGIDPGVRHILAVAAPRANVLASGGSCSILRGWSECMGVGVEWGGCLCLGLGFSRGE